MAWGSFVGCPDVNGSGVVADKVTFEFVADFSDCSAAEGSGHPYVFVDDVVYDSFHIPIRAEGCRCPMGWQGRF